jgi:WD40 repeat protein/serine/threonine protein kinase
MADVLHSSSPDVSSREERLAEVVLEYLKAIDAGEQPDCQQILARHADLAEELREFFDDQCGVEGRMAPIRLAVIDAASAVVPQRIGDYAILGVIARGGMGVVYKALQISARRTVALKMLRPDMPISELDLQRFRREEIANVANLDHPNIVPVYEVGEYQGRPFFSMKWIEGTNLTALPAGLAKNYTRLARLMEGVAQAVQHAHANRVIHRDLKPANVLLDKNGQPHVTDFGLAKRVPIDPATVVTAEANNSTMTEVGPALPAPATGLTPRNALAGTPPYMSPEAATSERRQTTAIDVYGLGAILYELLTGRAPFSGTLVQILADVIHKEPEQPRKVRPNVPADLEAICLKCLKKKPKDRYASAEKVAEDLRNYLENRPTHARPVLPPERLWMWIRRQPIIAALILTLIVVTVAGVVAFWVQWEQTITEARNAEYDRHVLQLRDAEYKISEKYLDQAHDLLHGCLDRFKLLEWNIAKRWSEGITASWEGHSTDIEQVCASGDGSLMASGDSAGGVRLWLLKSPGKSLVLQVDKGGITAVTSLTFSADASRLAAAFADTTVKVWDTRSRDLIFERAGAGRYVALNRDGALLATAGRSDLVQEANDLVEIWDVATEKIRMSFRHGGEVNALAFTRDDLWLVSAGYGEEVVRFWDVHGGGGAKPALHRSLSLWAIDVAVHPTRDYLAAVQGNTISLWDLRTGREYPLQRGDLSRCNSIAFSSDGRYLAGAYLSGVIVVWDVETKKPVFGARRRPQDSGKEMLTSVCFVRHGDEERVAYGRGASVVVERWLAQHNRPSRLWAGPPAVRCLTWHPQTGRVMGVTERGTVVQREIGGRAEWTPVPTAAALTVLTYSPDGACLAGAGVDRSLQLLRPESGKLQLMVPTEHTDKITGLAVASGQERLATSSLDHTFCVRHRDTGKVVFQSPPLEGPLHVVAFELQGKRLAVGGSDGLLQVWDLEGRADPLTLKGHEHDVTGVAFSPDGRWLASSGADARVLVWDARTGKEVCRFLGHIGTVAGVAFSRDGNRLASAGSDATVKLWDTTSENLLRMASRGQAQKKRPSQTPLLTLQSGSPVTGVAFGGGAAENWLAATHADGQVRLWNGSPEN